MKTKFLTLLLLLIVQMSFGLALTQDSPDIDLGSHFVDVTSMVMGVMLLVDFLKNTFKLNSTVTKIVSWGIGLAAPFIGHLIGVGGFLENYTEWWQLAIVAVVVAAAANGIADLGILRALINFIFKIDLKKRRVEE